MTTDDKALETVRRLRDVEERYWRIRLAKVRRELQELHGKRDALRKRLSSPRGRAWQGEGGEMDLGFREQAFAFRTALKRQIEGQEGEIRRMEEQQQEVLGKLGDVARDGRVLSAVLEERRLDLRKKKRKRSEEEQEDRGRGRERLERSLLMGSKGSKDGNS